MKVLLLNGSPHEKGCTYTALREVADTLEQKAGGFYLPFRTSEVRVLPDNEKQELLRFFTKESLLST